MAWRMVELELTRPIPAVDLAPDEDGLGLLARWNDRLVGFEMIPATKGARLTAEAVAALADARFGRAVLEARIEAALEADAPHAVGPSLTVAICTKDRAQRLERLLASLQPQVTDQTLFRAVEVLVVDNAPSDRGTRDVVTRLGWPHYRLEPKAGLDFARNAAVTSATGDLLAFLDDDVVVDRGWLAGLHAAWRANPEAGGYTGLVLPFSLATEAQIEFERRGGFGRGFRRKSFHPDMADDVLFPVGAGVVGAGCDMCFDRRLLQAIGGFDEALDTGAPLPGGGDLDIFYRVIRAGRAIGYEPRYAVYHEHRFELAQLKRQYWTWGLGFMAFLAKARRYDRALAERHRAMLRWWFLTQAAELARAVKAGAPRRVAFAFSELWGGIVGLFGEYDRSLRRTRRIKEQTP